MEGGSEEERRVEEKEGCGAVERDSRNNAKCCQGGAARLPGHLKLRIHCCPLSLEPSVRNDARWEQRGFQSFK